MPETPTGRLCWHELLTTNPEGAPGFYGDKVATCMDPDGATFAVHEVTPTSGLTVDGSPS